ncbi:MAG: TatD family hydrolase [Oscillospiraceae bacterium]|nr:TatD family hydrolase [Oscillospiraceae bacterium]
MNQYIDIGINLMHRSYSQERESVVRSAATVGVSPLIITGASLRSSEIAADYAAKHKNIYATAGVHPHDAKTCDGQTVEKLRWLSKQSQVVAIGECGLDYDRDFSPRDVQRKWFEAQIQLASEESMPLFLHERAAFADFKAILSSYREVCSRAAVHCFTGMRDELRAYIDYGRNGRNTGVENGDRQDIQCAERRLASHRSDARRERVDCGEPRHRRGKYRTEALKCRLTQN